MNSTTIIDAMAITIGSTSATIKVCLVAFVDMVTLTYS